MHPSVALKINDIDTIWGTNRGGTLRYIWKFSPFAPFIELVSLYPNPPPPPPLAPHTHTHVPPTYLIQPESAGGRELLKHNNEP